MARKVAALLKSTPVKLDRISRDFLAVIDKGKPVPGCEEQWRWYVEAAHVCEETQTRYDVIYRQVEKEGGTSQSKSWPAFIEAGKVHERAVNASIGALSAYLYAVKHKDDLKRIPAEELRMIAKESLSDKLEELQFSVNVGILGSHVATAVRNLTSDGFVDEPPMCDDCA